MSKSHCFNYLFLYMISSDLFLHLKMYIKVFKMFEIKTIGSKTAFTVQMHNCLCLICNCVVIIHLIKKITL